MINKPLVVNFFGGPGSGKSTAAAALFAALKMKHISCELVAEFAKDLIWEDNKFALTVQPYIFGNQYYRIMRCADDVDVIITDSPLLLPIVHNDDERCGRELNNMAAAAFSSFNNISFFLERPETYERAGRSETEEEAEQLTESIRTLIQTHGELAATMPCDAERNAQILSCVMDRLRQEGVISDEIPS